jgi:hypothetical protein
MRLYRFASFIFLFAVAACRPSVVQIENEELARLSSVGKITVVVYKPGQFNYTTSGDRMAIGLVGALTGGLGGAAYGAAQEAKADRFVKEYALDDPVVHARDAFTDGISNRVDSARLVANPEVLSDDDVETLQKSFGSGIILDFKTRLWGLASAPLRFSTYQVSYAVRARLLRLSDGKTLWQGYCEHLGSDDQWRATFDEFTANSGALLKQKLNESATACGKELVTQFSGK